MTRDRTRARTRRTARARVLGTATVVLTLTAAGCASDERPVVMPPTTRPPAPANASATTVPEPSLPAVTSDDVCELLTPSLRELVGAGPGRATSDDPPTCVATTESGETVSVEQRTHPKGIRGAIPEYEASRRGVLVGPVGDPSVPMLWAEPDGHHELAVFTATLTFVFRLPEHVGPDAALLEAIQQALTS